MTREVLHIQVPRRAARLGILSLLVLGCLLLAGCTSDANDRATRLFSLLLRASDLPPCWQRTRGVIGDWDQESKGIISRSVGFRGVPEQQRGDVLVSQELINYPSAAQAGEAYPSIVRVVIPTKSWSWPEQVSFRSQADQLQVACVQDPDSPETTWCSGVAQYGSFISVVRANVFEEQWLTMEDLERLLESVDARMAAARDQP